MTETWEAATFLSIYLKLPKHLSGQRNVYYTRWLPSSKRSARNLIIGLLSRLILKNWWVQDFLRLLDYGGGGGCCVSGNDGGDSGD